MKIAFYSPLKAPNHPVPSGDRLMARLLMQAMAMGSHEVFVASELRSFLRQPDDPERSSLADRAKREIETIAERWRWDGAPDLWFCYHPYYKAPDLLGPELTSRFNISYVTAEASYAPKRNAMGWQAVQDGLLSSLNEAAVNICFTERDREGLVQASPGLQWAMLPPFIDPAPFFKVVPQPKRTRLITVAMMRAGDKLESYCALSSALALLPQDLDWTLEIVGDGPEREAVQAMFSGFLKIASSGTGKKPQTRSQRFSRKLPFMSGRVTARPTALPIWKHRQPACPSSPKKWRAFPKS